MPRQATKNKSKSCCAAAGLHDRAEKLKQITERMMGEFREGQNHRQAERREGDERGGEDLRNEMHQRREELFELPRIVKELVERERRDKEQFDTALTAVPIRSGRPKSP